MRLLFVFNVTEKILLVRIKQCCRLFEHLVNGHQVTVATSCAKLHRLGKWWNPGSERKRRHGSRGFRIDRPRNPEKFSSVDASEVVWEEYATPLATQELWVDEMGPRTIEISSWLESQVSEFDVMIFFYYLYYPTIRGHEALLLGEFQRFSNPPLMLNLMLFSASF